MNFRLGSENDINRIAELEELCFSDPWSLDLIRDDVVGNRLSEYVLAVESSEGKEIILGYIGYWNISGECQINNVAVDPECRNRGVGYALIEEAVRRTEAIGTTLWTLEVRVGNEAAISLYKKFGFKTVGTRVHYYDDGEDAFLMTKKK